MQKYTEEFYNWVNYSKKVIPFVQWFYGRHWDEIDCSINIIENNYKNWNTSNGIIRSLHPPTTPIKLISSTSSTSTNNKTPEFVEAVALVKPTEEDNINRIHKQTNYTNLHLGTIAAQLTRIEEQVNQIREHETNQISAVKNNDVKPTSIRPPLYIKGFKLSNPKKNSDLLEE